MFRRKEKDGSTVLEGGSITLAEMVDYFHPVNSIIMTTDNVNPGTRFTGTTWVAWGAGRAVVGVGSNGVNTYTSEQTFGVDSITLTAAQCSVNAHTHPVSITSSTESVFHQHSISGRWASDTATASSSTRMTNVANMSGSSTGTAGSGLSANQNVLHVHNTVGDTGAVQAASSATAHENRQASIATYLWKRTV
jgi:hypothetical protein